VAVGADIGVDVEVVEEHEIIGNLVVVGRDVFTEEHQRRIAVAFFLICAFRSRSFMHVVFVPSPRF